MRVIRESPKTTLAKLETGNNKERIIIAKTHHHYHHRRFSRAI
jgi:hypothetical protein